MLMLFGHQKRTTLFACLFACHSILCCSAWLLAHLTFFLCWHYPNWIVCSPSSFSFGDWTLITMLFLFRSFLCRRFVVFFLVCFQLPYCLSHFCLVSDVLKRTSKVEGKMNSHYHYCFLLRLPLHCTAFFVFTVLAHSNIHWPMFYRFHLISDLQSCNTRSITFRRRPWVSFYCFTIFFFIINKWCCRLYLPRHLSSLKIALDFSWKKLEKLVNNWNCRGALWSSFFGRHHQNPLQHGTAIRATRAPIISSSDSSSTVGGHHHYDHLNDHHRILLIIIYLILFLSAFIHPDIMVCKYTHTIIYLYHLSTDS